MTDTTSSSTARDHYYQRIERHFGLRRGGPMLLSPRDWQLLDDWFEQGIPLRVVLRGINEAFDRHEASATSRRINSLAYCAPQIEGAWKADRELEAADGGRPAATGAPGASHLRECAATCEALAASTPGVAPILIEAGRALTRLADGDGTLDAVDAEAEAIESRLRDRLARAGVDLRLPRFSPWST